MSAPRANKEDKKKRLASRRSKAKQSEPHEADEINCMGSASVVEEENTESHVSNPDKSETETQHQPLSERTEKRRKLGSSRISKGRQNVKDPETASSYKAREVDEKPTGDEGLETTRVSWETQSEKQEDFSQAREHETSATQSSPLCSVSMSHDSEFDYVERQEDVSQMVISRSENLKANENERTVVSDSDKLATTVLKETHTTVTPLREKVREDTQSNDACETGLSVCSSTDQELIDQSNLEKMPKEEQSEVHSTTNRENTERCDDTDAPLLDGNLLSTNLMSESHMRVLEVCATVEITDQPEALPADEAQCEASSQDSAGEVAKGVNGTETFEIAGETLLIHTAVPVKRVETWPATSDTVRLPGICELNRSHMSPQVKQQSTGPPGVEEMPDKCSVIETESHDTDFLGQQAISDASGSKSSSSVTREITIERSRSGEHVEPERSAEQAAASGKELSANEEQNENFNLTDIMENICVSSGNLKTQAEFEDTQQSELHVKSFDDSGTSQEGSNPDKKHESLTKEKIFLPLEHMSKDYDSKKPHARSPERRDAELSQVYEAEGQPEENIKSTAEQTSHQQKEGLFYEGEASKYLQNLEPQIHFTLTSQPQENLMSTEEQTPDFSPVGSRRKLGSRRMNKGLQRDRDSPAESYHENGEDNIGHNRSNEMTMKQEETTQETERDIMSVTHDSSLYSVFMAGDCSQVQNPTTMCSQAALIEASENPQEANNENEADYEVEALNESLEDLSGGTAIADSPQSKERYAREQSVNTQTKEDQEHVGSHVYETKEVQTTGIEEPDDTGLFQLTEEDKEPTTAQTGHRGKRELWSPEVHTQPESSTEEVRLSSPIEELSKGEEQNINLCEAGGAQASDDAVHKVHEQDVKQTNKQMHEAQEEKAVFSVKPTHQAESMDTHQSNMEPQGRNTGADTELSEESVESQGQAEEAVHTETQDNTFSISQQETTDFRLVGNKRKVGSRRKNKGQQQVKDSDVETATTSETEIQETSLETMLEETDTPQTKDVRDQGEEDAHTGTGVQPNVTDDGQVMDQSDFTKVHANECLSSATHTESNDKDRDTDLLKQRETLQANSCESGLKPEGSESSVALDKTTEKSTFEEETGPEGRVEQAALSSPKKEQNESLVLCEVTEHTHTHTAQDAGYVSVGENRSSAQSQSDVHGPVDSQPQATSQNKEESHTGSKSAEHRRKLGSSRRTKGKQHGLDSASETDLKLKEDAGNTRADEEVSLTTDTTRQEELKQQTDPGVNASEQLRRSRNEGETTRKIRKEDTTSPHNVMENSITETSDVTSRSDKDDALHKHTDESENLTLLTGKRDSVEDVDTLMVTTETLQNRQPQPSLSNQLLQPEAMKSADVPGVTVHEANHVNEGANDTNFDIRSASPNFNSPNRRRKMGSTRRNLGSPSKQEPLNQKQDIPKTAGGAGDGLSENASGTTWLQLQEQHQEREENEGVEHSSISESQFKAVVYQTADRNPDAPSLSEESGPPVNQDYLATKPSTSPEQDVTAESSNGGRRRKFGSNRKSRGNHEDQTAGEDRIIAAPTDGGPTEERTNNGERGEESVALDKQEQQPHAAKRELHQNEEHAVHTTELHVTSNIQIHESDKKLSPNVSSAGESWRPGSEKGKQVAPHVGINLSHKSFSLAADSTEADVGSRGYNVLMVGDTGVGKTSFMKRAQSGKFSLDLPSSVGLDSCPWTVVVDGKRVVLHLWDTAGQERFHSITTQIFHKAQAFLLMYDVTSSKSFSAVSYWANCIQEGAAENVSVLLLGNKSDRAERQVKPQDGECLAKEYNFDFMECSAATGQNVIECLETIARTLTQRAGTRQEAVALKQEPQPKKRSGCC